MDGKGVEENSCGLAKYYPSIHLEGLKPQFVFRIFCPNELLIMSYAL
jgi:hypothetical protein